MITASSVAHPDDWRYDGWAQSGYGQAGPANTAGYNNTAMPNGIWQFSQYTYSCKMISVCGGSPTRTTFLTPNPDPSVPWIYTARWRTDIDDRIHMYANGIQIDKTNYNPAGVWVGQWRGQYFGETREVSSDIVGTAADVTLMDLVRWVDSSQTFHFANLDGSDVTACNGCDRYHSVTQVQSSGGTEIKIWTDPIHL